YVLLFAGVFLFADILLDVVEAQLLFVGAEGLFLDLLALLHAIIVVVEQVLAILVVATGRDIAADKGALAELAGERDSPALARILVNLTNQSAQLMAVGLSDRGGIAVAAGH